MKLKNAMKYGIAAAALSMMLLCAPAAYAEEPAEEVLPEQPAAAAETAVEDDNALFSGMRLSQSSLTLTISSSERNPSAHLSVTRTEESYSRVNWYSSNGSVASVDSSGNVTAHGEGRATITATTNTGESATCTVWVERAEPKLNQSSATLIITYDNPNPTLQLSLKSSYYGSSYESWTSSNTNVATVSNGGMVTAHSTGKTTITARTSSGESAKCTVTVTSSVGEVSLDRVTLLMPEIGSVQQLSATIADWGGDGMKRTWTSNNPSVATVSEDGWVTAVGSGEAKITVISPTGKYAECTCYVGDAARAYETQQNINTALGVVILIGIAGLVIFIMMS